MTIAAILRDRAGEVVTATPDIRVLDIIDLLADRRIGAVPVIEGDRVVGIFSERDVIYGLRKAGPSFLDRVVGEVMTTDVVKVSASLPLLDALGLMTRRRIRHLPVVEDDRLIGIVSIGDLVKKRMDMIETEASAMREYIQTV